MDPQTAGYVCLAGVLGLLGIVGFVFFRISSSAAAESLLEAQAPLRPQTEQVSDGEEDVRMAGHRRGAAGRMHAGRLRQRLAAQVAVRAAEQEGSSSEGSDAGSQEEGEAGARGNKKQRLRAAKQEAREAERIAREEQEGRGAKGSRYDEKRRQKDAAREAKEAAQEADAQRAAEEKAKEEEEEAAKWMGMISVEQEGTGEEEAAAEGGGALGQFVEYIKTRKTVPLEQLAIDFKMRTTDVIDRIQGLEAMGRLTGVMDDRGKYIYISLEEMHAVANFLKQKGRVTIRELAAKSAVLIDLDSKAASATLLHTEAGLSFDMLEGEGVVAA